MDWGFFDNITIIMGCRPEEPPPPLWTKYH